MDKKTLWVLVIIIIVLLIGGFWLFGNNSNQNNVPTGEVPVPISSATDTTVTINTATTTANEKDFTVIGTSFSYNPKTITINKGDLVKITFKDSDGFHDLVIDGYKVNTEKINSGQEQTISFVADKVGTFAYYCSVDSHRAKGMEGQLIVK